MEQVDRLLDLADADLAGGLTTTALGYCGRALRVLAELGQHNRDSRRRYERLRDIQYRSTMAALA